MQNDLTLNVLMHLDDDDHIGVRMSFATTFNYPVRFRSSETLNSIGVGASSPVMDQHGSVGFIRGRETDLLFLGISQFDFNSSCIPNSLISMSLDEPDWLVDGTVDLVSAGEVVRTQVEPFYANIYEYKNGFPIEVVQPIIDHLRSHGAVGSTTFTHCTSTTVESAPLIRLSFGERNDEKIVLYPEDYMEFNSTSNSCTLLFRRFHSISMWEFAPFTIPQTNVFVTNNSLFICDSLL